MTKKTKARIKNSEIRTSLDNVGKGSRIAPREEEENVTESSLKTDAREVVVVEAGVEEPVVVPHKRMWDSTKCTKIIQTTSPQFDTYIVCHTNYYCFFNNCYKFINFIKFE